MTTAPIEERPVTYADCQALGALLLGRLSEITASMKPVQVLLRQVLAGVGKDEPEVLYARMTEALDRLPSVPPF